MLNKLLRSDDLWFLGRRQIPQKHIACDKEVTLLGATENENVIRVCQPVPQRPYSWEQSFSLDKVYRQHSQMVSDPFEFWSACCIRRQKQFLKHNGINSEPNSAIRFRGKQLRRQRIAPQVANDHVRVKEHKGTISTQTFFLFGPLAIGDLLHSYHCMRVLLIQMNLPSPVAERLIPVVSRPNGFTNGLTTTGEANCCRNEEFV